MQLTYHKLIDILDLKNIPSKRIGYSLQPGPGRYEYNNLNKTLESLLPDNVEASIIIDVIRLKSNLYNNQTLIFPKMSFFYTIVGFTQSHSGVLGDIEGLIQKNPDT